MRYLLLVLICCWCSASEIPGLDRVTKDVPKALVDEQLADYVAKLNLDPVPVPNYEHTGTPEQVEKMKQAKMLNSTLSNYRERIKEAKATKMTPEALATWNQGTLATLGRNELFARAYKSAHGSLPPFHYVAKQ